MRTASDVIRELDLAPLPEEGGFFRRVYTHAATLPEDPVAPGRPVASAILFLLTGTRFSALHRLSADELFHFHAGSPVAMLQLHPDGTSEMPRLGDPTEPDNRSMALVPGGSWQGTRLLDEDPEAFALMGVSVHPGFDWRDFALAEREPLLRRFPDRADAIRRLTRDA